MKKALLLTIIATVPAVATAQEVSRFRTRAGGSLSGTEEFTIARTASGHELSAKAVLNRGGGETTFTLKETLAADWSPLAYTIDVSGAMGQASVAAEKKGEVFAFAVKAAAGSASRELPAKPRTVLLDNLLAAPLQVLLHLGAAAPGPIALIVPLQMTPVDGSLRAAGTEQASLDGKPIRVAKLVFEAAGVSMELHAEAATNRLMRAFVATQDAEIVREGFSLAAGQESPQATPAEATLPEGVSEREVAFKTPDGTVFSAALCLPSKAGSPPPPIVVLAQGSGPQDRDETIGPNKPFRDIAWGLATRGIATFRFPKRTLAFPGTYKGTLDSESIDDATAAVAFVRSLPEVDGKAVFVLGHSLGGLAAAYVAQRVPLSGLILASAPGRTLDLVIRDQVRSLNAAKPAAEQASLLELQDAIMAKVRAGTATAADLRGQAPPAALRDTIIRDPIAELRKTSLPLLVVKGGKDAQVFQPDYDALQALISSRPGSEAWLFPNLTHILTPTDGPADVAAIMKPGHVAPEVLDTIAGWVKARGNASR